MSVNWLDAVIILGLTFDESMDPAAIRSAWKQRIRKAHPDKSQGRGTDATMQTQRLNEAKDVLVARAALFSTDPADEERERRRRERERQEEEERRRADEARQAREKVQREKFERECEEMYNRMKEARRERYARNRRKRAPGTRVHRKVEEYKEGKELVEEMQAFFREGFVVEPNHKLLVRAVLDLFIKSRSGPTSDLELNLYKRHSKRLFKEAWPGVVFSTLRNKRCYWNVAVKH